MQPEKPDIKRVKTDPYDFERKVRLRNAPRQRHRLQIPPPSQGSDLRVGVFFCVRNFNGKTAKAT